jgi:hypothetical protein
LKNELAAELAATTNLHSFSTRLLASTELEPLLERWLACRLPWSATAPPGGPGSRGESWSGGTPPGVLPIDVRFRVPKTNAYTPGKKAAAVAPLSRSSHSPTTYLRNLKAETISSTPVIRPQAAMTINQTNRGQFGPHDRGESSGNPGRRFEEKRSRSLVRLRCRNRAGQIHHCVGHCVPEEHQRQLIERRARLR